MKWLDGCATEFVHLHGEKDGEFSRLGEGIVVEVEEWDKPEGKSWSDDEVMKNIQQSFFERLNISIIYKRKKKKIERIR